MKKTILVFIFILQLPLCAGIYTNLLSMNEKDLNRDLFVCRDHICSVSEKLYFNQPLLDEAITTIETYSNEKGDIYKVILYIHHLDSFRNTDVVGAIYRAVKKYLQKESSVEVNLEYLSDKYGNKSLITIVDKRKREYYQEYIEKIYTEAMKSFKEQP